MFKSFRKLWITLGVLVLLSPLGLLASGTAFGEWGLDQLKEEVGFVPAGVARFADLYHSILPDYSVPALGSSAAGSIIGYILSAIAGVVLIIGVFTLFAKIIKD
jgi:uncharacterized membrane protein YphA (DoxX/SURF4 family)